LVVGHLVAALTSLNVPADIITDVVGVVSPLRPVFVEGYEKYNKAQPAQLYIAVAVVAVVLVVAFAFAKKASR
jgi:hypothetical protein